MKGALPQFQRQAFDRVSALGHEAFALAVEPVNDSLRTTGLDVSSCPTTAGRAVVTTFSTPGGMPARWANSASAKAHKGVASAGLTTMVQPAARPAPPCG